MNNSSTRRPLFTIADGGGAEEGEGENGDADSKAGAIPIAPRGGCPMGYG